MSEPTLQIDVYDKARQWVGSIGDPVSLTGPVRFNGTSAMQLRIRSTDPMSEELQAKGARVGIRYRGVDLESFAVRTMDGQILPNGDVVAQLEGDYRIFGNTLALVNPGNFIEATSLEAGTDENLAQSWLPGGFSDAGPNGTTVGQTGVYLWPDGSAAAGGVQVDFSESAIKTIIAANFARLGRPVTILPDLLRGGDARAAGILPEVRNQSLAEVLQPILQWSGLGLRARQGYREDTITVDVYETGEWSAPLTVGSGIVTDGSWSKNPPIATRVLGGGPGDGVDRAFIALADTALEEEYGDVIEVYRDATGAAVVWPNALASNLRVAKYYMLRPEIAPQLKADFLTYLQRAVAGALAEGAATTGVSTELSESQSFYFGGEDGVQLGDLVTIQPDGAGGPEFVDRVTEAEFSLTSAGLRVTPILGSRLDDPMRQLADAVAMLAGSQRRISSNR